MEDKKRDFYSGVLMLVIGIVTTYGSLGYRIGTLSRMGPGFFPLTLGIILILVALLIMFIALRRPSTVINQPSAEGALTENLNTQTNDTSINEQEESIDTDQRSLPQRWRAPICLIIAVSLFIVLGRYGGLMVATFAVVFISALGDPDNSLKTSFLTALVVTIFAVVVFHFGLRMQFPLFSWG